MIVDKLGYGEQCKTLLVLSTMPYFKKVSKHKPAAEMVTKFAENDAKRMKKLLPEAFQGSNTDVYPDCRIRFDK